MNKLLKIVMFGFSLLFGMALAAHAADPTTVDGVVTAVAGIPDVATTTYIAAAVLGFGILTVGVIVWALKKGVGLKK